MGGLGRTVAERQMPKYVILMMVRESEALAKAVHKKLSEFSMADPAHLTLINHQDYLRLVKEGQIAESDFWYPRKDEYALTITEYYSKYRETIDKMRTCAGDFMEGWHAAKK